MDAAVPTQDGLPPYLSSVTLRHVEPFSSEVCFLFGPNPNPPKR